MIHLLQLSSGLSAFGGSVESPSTPAPYILPAGTDARHLCEICDCVIRFAPIEMNDKQFASVHSENEHISLEAIANSVVFYKHYLKNYI